MRLATAAAALRLVASPAEAQAPRTVHLVSPSCGELPFAEERFRELLVLELQVDGVVLVDDPALAEALLSYEPDPCGPGATHFALRLMRGRTLHLNDADVGEVPLATVPRALALEMAEMLRGDTEAAPPIEEAPPAPPAPEPPPPLEAPIEPAPHRGPHTRLGAAATVRNVPETGAVLAGALVFADLPIADELPLVVRIDAGARLGPSAHDVALGAVTGGVTISIWARALDALAVRFGPRLWVGYGFALDPERSGATPQSEPLLAGVSVVTGGELALSDALSLLLELEVGTHLHGLEYTLPGGRTGFVGAYWGGQLALAWRV